MHKRTTVFTHPNSHQKSLMHRVQRGGGLSEYAHAANGGVGQARLMMDIGKQVFGKTFADEVYETLAVTAGSLLLRDSQIMNTAQEVFQRKCEVVDERGCVPV